MIPFVVAFSTGSCTCIMGVSTQLVVDMLPQPLSTNLKIQVQPSSSIGLIILIHVHKCTYYNYIHVHDYSYIFRDMCVHENLHYFLSRWMRLG